MIITKSHIKILNYIYSKEPISYHDIKKKFTNYTALLDTIESLTRHHYLIQVGGYQNNLGNPIPITDITMFEIDDLGKAEVEKNQWFDIRFVLTSLIIPIIVGVSSSAITAILLLLLG